MKNILLIAFALTAALPLAAADGAPAPAARRELLPVTACSRSAVKLLTIRGREVSEGSGFFAGAPGMAVTNAHVIDGASHIYLFIPSPGGAAITVRAARLLRTDTAHDLALLQVEGNDLPPALPLAPQDASLLEDVVSIGYPGDIDEAYAKSLIARRLKPGSVFTEPAVLAYLLPHFTKGHIAKIVPGRFYHTAAIDRGNSGGPLVNCAGEVVGINRSATTDPFYPFCFAIPVAHLRELLRAPEKTAP